MRSLPAETPDVKIENCRDVVELVSDTINQIRKGQLDPRIGNALGYLSAVLIKAAEQGDMERRIDDLEALVKGRKHTMDCGLDFGSTNGNT